MTVIAPSRRPDSHDGDSTVEPVRGGQARIEESQRHVWPRGRPSANEGDIEALIREARRRARRRRTAIAAVIAAALALFAGATGIAVSLAPATSAPQADLGTSTPAKIFAVHPTPSAELVASFYTHWSAGGGDEWIYVYDDGRIVFRGLGWEQQRLTPDGLEALRAGILASDMLGPSRYAHAQQWGAGAFIQLRVDGVITAAWQPPRTAHDEVAAFDRVIRQLMDFEDWLPASAWAQPKRSPYVSPGYGVCAQGEEPPSVSDPDAVLAHLPPDAAALLAVGPRIEAIDPVQDAYAGSGMMPSSDIVGCHHLTPAQAQSVVDALVLGGWGVEDSGPPPPGDRVVLAERERIDPFDMVTSDPAAGNLRVWFNSILPHGVPECACYA